VPKPRKILKYQTIPPSLFMLIFGLLLSRIGTHRGNVLSSGFRWW